METSPGSKQQGLTSEVPKAVREQEKPPYRQQDIDNAELMVGILRGELGGILGNNISRRTTDQVYKITKENQKEIMANMQQDIFGTLKEIQPNTRIPSEMTPLIEFLDLSSGGSIFLLAPTWAVTTTVLKVGNAAKLLKCQEALDWIDIITNGDPSGHEQTPIRTLIDKLGQSVVETGLYKRMENAIADEIEELADAHFRSLWD